MNRIRYRIYCSGNDAYLSFDYERNVVGWGNDNTTWNERELMRIECLLLGNAYSKSDGLIWVRERLNSIISSIKLVRKRGWSVYAIPIGDVTQMEFLPVKALDNEYVQGTFWGLYNLKSVRYLDGIR